MHMQNMALTWYSRGISNALYESWRMIYTSSLVTPLLTALVFWEVYCDCKSSSPSDGHFSWESCWMLGLWLLTGFEKHMPLPAHFEHCCHFYWRLSMLTLVFNMAFVTQCIVKITIFVISLVVPCLPLLTIILTQMMCVTGHTELVRILPYKFFFK